MNSLSFSFRTNGLLRRCSTPIPVSTFLAKLGSCAESYVEKCPFGQIPKNLAYRKCKNLAHYLAKLTTLNGQSWGLRLARMAYSGDALRL